VLAVIVVWSYGRFDGLAVFHDSPAPWAQALIPWQVLSTITSAMNKIVNMLLTQVNLTSCSVGGACDHLVGTGHHVRHDIRSTSVCHISLVFPINVVVSSTIRTHDIGRFAFARGDGASVDTTILFVVIFSLTSRVLHDSHTTRAHRGVVVSGVLIGAICRFDPLTMFEDGTTSGARGGYDFLLSIPPDSLGVQGMFQLVRVSLMSVYLAHSCMLNLLTKAIGHLEFSFSDCRCLMAQIPA
jgi:hypothetical protein